MALPLQIKNHIDTLYDKLQESEETKLFVKFTLGGKLYKIRVYKEPDPSLGPDVKYRIDIVDRGAI